MEPTFLPKKLNAGYGEKSVRNSVLNQWSSGAPSDVYLKDQHFVMN